MKSKPLSISLKMLLVYAIVLISSNLAMAQIGGAGSIQGIISDSSGAVIPGASAVATNVATGVKISRQTTAAGLYPDGRFRPDGHTAHQHRKRICHLFAGRGQFSHGQ